MLFPSHDRCGSVAPDYRITGRFSVSRHGVDVTFRSQSVRQSNPRPRERERKDRSKRMPRFARLVHNMLQGALDAAGTMSEVQDLVEAFAWNAHDRYGRNAMALVRREALDASMAGEGHGLYKGWATNWRSYALVAEGIASGRFEVDLGGALQSYAVSQALDAAAGAQGRARQSLANSLGYDSPIGLQALEGLHSGALGIKGKGG